MSVVKHEISLRPHMWQQRFFWSKARFVGIICGVRQARAVLPGVSRETAIQIVALPSGWVRNDARVPKA
jgi:hypothetical protein